MRARPADLWAILAATNSGRPGLRRLSDVAGHRIAIDDLADGYRRYQAYVAQARDLFDAAHSSDDTVRPLPAYYFALNLAKAWLTCVDPPLTSGRLYHGLTDAFDWDKQRWHFPQEQFEVKQSGVFRLLAERSGHGFCYPRGKRLAIRDLAPYFTDTWDVSETATGTPPKVIPLESVFVLKGKASGAQSMWVRVEVERDQLQMRGMGPEALVGKTAHFGDAFRLVETDRNTASFESLKAIPYGRNPQAAFPVLQGIYEGSLLTANRAAGPVGHFAVLSGRKDLLSQDAIRLAVLQHLSNMVRYRPVEIQKMMDTEWAWILSVWVPRAIDNYLLSLSTRILGEELWTTSINRS